MNNNNPDKKLKKDELNEISKKIDKFVQIQDFSTVQNALLAILFSILIFSITIIISGDYFEVLFRLIAGLLLMFDLPMLYFVVLSIFYGKNNFKLRVLGISFFYVVIVSIMTLIIFLFELINQSITPPHPVDNVVAVMILFFTFFFSVIFFNNVNVKYYKRFKLLIDVDSDTKKPYTGKNKVIIKMIEFSNKKLFVKTLYRYNFQIRNSIIGALLVTILTGLIKNPFSINNINAYGFPVYWIIYNPNETIGLSTFLIFFFGDWILYTPIVFIYLMIILYYFHFPKQKTEIKNLIKLKNIGAATVKKFEDIGIYYIEEISKIELDRIVALTGIGKKRVEIILKNIDDIIKNP